MFLLRASPAIITSGMTTKYIRMLLNIVALFLRFYTVVLGLGKRQNYDSDDSEQQGTYKVYANVCLYLT